MPTQREAFIPITRRALIERCIADSPFSASDIRHFREFCDILSAYVHFQFHETLETIKESYAPFNPNGDGPAHPLEAADNLKAKQTQFTDDFCHLLDKSNYIELSKGTLRRALQERSLVALRTDVNFDDFQQFHCYYRGDTTQVVPRPSLWSRQKTETIDVLERVVLLIQFKDPAYFAQRSIDVNRLDYEPGKIYLYFYKDVPKYDLELLFPNVRISMTWRDRLMLLIPALGAGIGVLLRVLPQLLFILVALLVVLQVDPMDLPQWLRQSGTQASPDTLALLVTTLSLVVALGGFAAKQYSTYKSKKIKFQKNVTDTLFFRSIANHSAVFQLLIDIAEEEECKEVILAYYHLLINPQPLSARELDDTIEQWLQQQLPQRVHDSGIAVDFDIQDALDKLLGLTAVMEDGSKEQVLRPQSSDQTTQRYTASSLTTAKRVIDRLWDHAFLYSES